MKLRHAVMSAFMVLAVAVAALIVTPSAGAARPPAPLPPRISMTGCPTLIFYGVRGSGEAFDDGTLALGPTLYSLYRNLADEYEQGFVGAVANGYRAVPVKSYKVVTYTTSVAEGVASMTADLPALSTRCPDSYFVVAGYSQGADVVRRALPDLDSATRGRISRVQLFGDPNWRPNEPGIQESGDFGATDTGIATKVSKLRRLPALPTDLGSRVQSWCHAADPICQGSNWFDSGAHGRYVGDDTLAAAWRIGQRFLADGLLTSAPTAYVMNTDCSGTTPRVWILLDMSNQWASFTASVDVLFGQTSVLHTDMHGGNYFVQPYPLPPGTTLVWVLGGTTRIEQRYVQAPAC
jgi:cutinase